MAPALAEGSVVPAAAVACGAGLVLLLLLLLCSFFHRENRRFSTQTMRTTPGLVRGTCGAAPPHPPAGVTAAPLHPPPPRPGSRLPKWRKLVKLVSGTPSPGEPRQQADGPAVPEDPGLHVPGWTPHSHALSGPTPKTPEFLRHRQLPVLPGDAGTPAADCVPDAEGTIYESIRYKSRTMKHPRDAGSAPEDSPSLPAGDKLSIPVPEVIIREEPGSEGSPVPVYARVCKPPRVPQPWQPASPPEAQEETPPMLPEKHFDVA
ncbi:uncharacterized protein LOC129203975 [Grus americana]|uniref:uncharacterized protein LOC129203975 n=1 Tax=Grus americana TaxID=9117 RepID=UPI002407C7E0|nr:uncharacterized protein LOC129203975 [Grus americana]